MNRKKLVEVADQVLMDVDDEFKIETRDYFEKELCRRLSRIFLQAESHFETATNSIYYSERKEAYYSVKPVLDDCLDKILGEKK